MNSIRRTKRYKYESAKLTNLTTISRSFMSKWFSSIPLTMSIRTPPPPLIPWLSVRGRMKINVTVKFLKWQRDFSVWPIHSLATLYTVYKIRTKQPHSWFQVDEINVVLWWSNIFIVFGGKVLHGRTHFSEYSASFSNILEKNIFWCTGGGPYPSLLTCPQNVVLFEAFPNSQSLATSISTTKVTRKETFQRPYFKLLTKIVSYKMLLYDDENFPMMPYIC